MDLGCRLRDAGLLLSSIVSSPFSRCTQTCENIVQGHGSRTVVQKEDMLAYPGSFLLYDPDDRSPNPGSKSKEPGSYENQANNGDLSEGVKNVLTLVLNQHPLGNGICVLVTHDAIIAPVLTFLTNEAFDPKEKWIDYLDGFALCKVNQKWIVIHGHGAGIDVTSRVNLVKSL
jgi:broad specificity phosphatase PhoE